MKSCIEKIQIGDLVGVSFFYDYTGNMVWLSRIEQHYYTEFKVVDISSYRNRVTIGHYERLPYFTKDIHNWFPLPYYFDLPANNLILKIKKSLPGSLTSKGSSK